MIFRWDMAIKDDSDDESDSANNAADEDTANDCNWHLAMRRCTSADVHGWLSTESCDRGRGRQNIHIRTSLVTTSTNSSAASDRREVGLLQQRSDVALVPCGHSRFCATCADSVASMDSEWLPNMHNAHTHGAGLYAWPVFLFHTEWTMLVFVFE